jgi:hypothetical protein
MKRDRARQNRMRRQRRKYGFSEGTRNTFGLAGCLPLLLLAVVAVAVRHFTAG